MTIKVLKSSELMLAEEAVDIRGGLSTVWDSELYACTSFTCSTNSISSCPKNKTCNGDCKSNCLVNCSGYCYYNVKF